MNSFSHAFRFLGNPRFVTGTCVPDWLSACDRKCRARKKLAQAYLPNATPEQRPLVLGIIQHHEDDHWFHKTPAFNELSLVFAKQIRARLGEPGFRPALLGHIIIEIFLDAYLQEQHPGRLDSYYEQIASVSPELIQDTVNAFVSRPTRQLVPFVAGFLKSRYVFDYLDDEKMKFRVNQVFQRLRLEPIKSELDAWFVESRAEVYRRVSELLLGFPKPNNKNF